jgi:hypothetical protein
LLQDVRRADRLSRSSLEDLKRRQETTLADAQQGLEREIADRKAILERWRSNEELEHVADLQRIQEVWVHNCNYTLRHTS